MYYGYDGLLSNIARTVWYQVVVSTNAHVAVFTPTFTPAVFDQPVLFAVGLKTILPDAHNCYCVVGALFTAAALFLKVCYDSITVVLYAVINVETTAQSTLASQLF